MSHKEYLQLMATEVAKRLPDNHGFILLTFPFNTEEGRCNYVANGSRKDCINAMKEFMVRCGAQEDWMRNLP